jgi:hypothetical protein
MWPLIIGGALMTGGAAASMQGNRMATRAGRRVVQAERGRQAGMDRELAGESDTLINGMAPSPNMSAEIEAGNQAAAGLDAVGTQVQDGAAANGGPVLTPGRMGRVRSAAQQMARMRAAKKAASDKSLLADQFNLNKTRIQQRSRNSQGIAAVEAEDAAQAGGNWRMLGGLMSAGGMGSMMAG